MKNWNKSEVHEYLRDLAGSEEGKIVDPLVTENPLWNGHSFKNLPTNLVHDMSSQDLNFLAAVIEDEICSFCVSIPKSWPEEDAAKFAIMIGETFDSRTESSWEIDYYDKTPNLINSKSIKEALSSDFPIKKYSQSDLYEGNWIFFYEIE